MGKDKGKSAVVGGGNPNHAPQEVREDQSIAIVSYRKSKILNSFPFSNDEMRISSFDYAHFKIF